MKELDVIDVNRWKTENKSRNQEELTAEERRYRAGRARAKKMAAKRRKRQQRVRLVLCLGVIVLGIFGITKGLGTFVETVGNGDNIDTSHHNIVTSENISNTAETEDKFLYEVKFKDFFEKNTPEVLEESQVYRRLKKLAEEYPELEKIYEESDRYPIKMLASLCNNPEMYQYVEGYLSYEAGDRSVVKEAVLSEEEKNQRYPLFLQWDARWGYEEYGDFNIALSGCGPTTLAMAIAAVTGDREITPDDVARYSMEHGFYVEGTGTAWSLMTEGAEDFQVEAKEISLDENVMKNALDDGKVIICSMRPGKFTSVGHFIMIYDYDKNGFKINDSNSIYRSSRYWTYEELKSQIRILWSYEEILN